MNQTTATQLIGYSVIVSSNESHNTNWSAMTEMDTGGTVATDFDVVMASGLEVERFMEVLRPSALYAPTVDKKLDRMLSHDFSNPNFSTALLRKDLQLFVREAALSGVNAAALAGLVELLVCAEGTPLDAGDYSALHALTGGSVEES